LWLADITEHKTSAGKLYLCAIKDVFSNRIVGYSISDRMKSDRQGRGRPGERAESAVWVLITQRSQVQILPPLQSKTAGQCATPSQEWRLVSVPPRPFDPLRVPDASKDADAGRGAATWSHGGTPSIASA
jgi:hypothetical protein